jgi:hypothetical protein
MTGINANNVFNCGRANIPPTARIITRSASYRTRFDFMAPFQFFDQDRF